jgi:cytochrome d ubiquinol oxidase subunit I
MDDFLAARSQMALSLGFHIIYSCIGMVMPVFMAISHYKWIKTKNPVYKNITIAWSKGRGYLFCYRRCIRHHAFV